MNTPPKISLNPKRKVLIFYLLIVLFVLSGALAFGYIQKEKSVYFVQQPNVTTEKTSVLPSEIDTSDWKTYRNEVIGIEFQYPNDWPTLQPTNSGDILKNGKVSDSFFMPLDDFSSLSHSPLGRENISYDNKPIEEQYKIIKCQDNIKTIISCEEKTSNNGVKYVQKVYDIGINDPSKMTFDYYVFVATGKYILTFDFQNKDNCEKRIKEYQRLLSTLKIP